MENRMLPLSGIPDKPIFNALEKTHYALLLDFSVKICE